MLVYCLACESVFEPEETPDDVIVLCLDCAGKPAAITTEARSADTVRARCPACGYSKDIARSRALEEVRCAGCGVVFPVLPPPAEEAAGGPEASPPPAPAPHQRAAILAPTPEPLGGLPRWAFALSLLPLAWIMLFPPPSLRDRVEAMLERDPALLERVQAAASETEYFDALPDRRIEGALLAYDSRMHWTFAAASAVLGAAYFVLCWPAGRALRRHAIGVAAFTSTAGVLLLLLVQFVAEVTQGVVVTGGGLTVFFWAVLRFIGFSYRAAMDPNNGFLASLGGFTFGVGLCEEICKSLPLVAHIRSADRGLDWRGLVFWALFSGLGFGVAEGILYAADFYNGVHGAAVYVVRFIPCVALHSAWTGITAVYLYRSPDAILGINAWYEWFPAVFFPALPSILLHGLYDTLLKRDHEVTAMLVAAASFAAFLLLVRRTRHRQEEARARAARACAR